VRRALLLGLVLVAATPAPAGAAERAYTGIVEVRHDDGPQRTSVPDRLVLRTDDGVLRIAERRLHRFVGRRVKVLAERDGSTLRVERVAAADGAAPAQQEEEADTWPTYPPPATGPRRVAVLLASTAGEAPARWAKEPIEEMMFGPGLSVAQHVAGQNTRTTIDGDVLGWYTVDVPATGCPDYLYEAHAMEAARDAGVDFSDYHYVMTVFPRRPCGYNGLAYIGGVSSYINGRPGDFRLLAHELGHNLGLSHAGAHVCTEDGRDTTTTGQCSYRDYGDPFDVMGHAPRAFFNGFHRAQLGWIAPGAIVTSREEGTYALRSINDPATGTKLLMVPRDVPDEYTPLLGPRYIAVESRSPAPAFDDFAPGDPIVSGVTLRITLGTGWSWPTRLLDVTPGSPGGYGDAALAVGQSFTDPPTGARYTLESLEGGVAQVRLAYPPTAPSGLEAALDGPDSATVAWAASTDVKGVAGYELERDGVVVARTSEELRASDAGLPRGRTVSYRVLAVDTDGNRTASYAVTLDTPPPDPQRETASSRAPPDRTAPRLRVFPRVGRAGRPLPRSRRLVVLVADDRPGARVAATFDARPLGAAAARRLVLRLPRRALRGRHALVLAATDAAGNRRTVRLRIARGRVRTG
jgi:hypothetical protein